MVTFGLDISHHQGIALDFSAFRQAGIEFVFIKSSEGSNYTDPQFANNLSRARAAGMLVAAYHYVRSNATAAAQVTRVSSVVPRDVPVIPDVEANSGGVALLRDFVARLKIAGYHVPMVYLPRWYWQQIGSPSLIKPDPPLPPLWSSRYPDNVVDDFREEYKDAPATYWNGYGGLDVTVLQFTSSARVAGRSPLDANAYRGTREQLAAVLGAEEQEDMSMYDKVKFTSPDGTSFEKTHSELLADVYKALLFTSGAPERPNHNTGHETVHDAIWNNRDGIENTQKLVSNLQVGMQDAVREALGTALQTNPPTVQVDAEAIAKATVAELKKEGN